VSRTPPDIEPEDAIRALHDAVELKDAVAAVKVLGELGAGASHLWDLIESRRSPHLREAALQALGRFDPETAEEHVPVLTLVLRDSNPYVVAAACGAAASLQLVELAPTIRSLLTNLMGRIRGAAILALGRIGDASDEKAILAGCADPDDRIAEKASRALLNLGRRGVLSADHLGEVLHDLLPAVAERRTGNGLRYSDNLAKAAAFAAPDADLDAILEDLLLHHVGARGSAAETLAARGADHVRPAIEQLLLDDPSDRLRSQLIGALRTLGIEPSLGILATLVDGPLNTSVRQAVLAAVRDVDHPAAHTLLVRLATSADVAVRASAVYRLDPDHPLGTDLALRALIDSAPLVRRAAIVRLGSDPAMAPALLAARSTETQLELAELLDEILADFGDEAVRNNGGPALPAPAAPLALQLLPVGDDPVSTALQLAVSAALSDVDGPAAERDRAVATVLDRLAGEAARLAGALKGSQ